ncbi:MAG: hypothetical protein EXQ47_07920 [Bryobacterales bacterium]|nr:hypothetical protein [Bryobacterales bacterium]
MPLSPGEKFGPYYILALIGKGGIGEVYKAKDTKLKRDVALKVLPAAFLRDSNAKPKFWRRRIIPTSRRFHPRWRPDGKELFYATPDGQLMAVEVAARNGALEVGRGQKLFDGIITSGGWNYDVSADGQKIVVVDGGASSLLPVTLLQNWPASLRK